MLAFGGGRDYILLTRKSPNKSYYWGGGPAYRSIGKSLPVDFNVIINIFILVLALWGQFPTVEVFWTLLNCFEFVEMLSTIVLKIEAIVERHKCLFDCWIGTIVEQFWNSVEAF